MKAHILRSIHDHATHSPLFFFPCIMNRSNTKYGRQKVADNLGEKAQAMLGAIISATGKCKMSMGRTDRAVF